MTENHTADTASIRRLPVVIVWNGMPDKDRDQESGRLERGCALVRERVSSWFKSFIKSADSAQESVKDPAKSGSRLSRVLTTTSFCVAGLLSWMAISQASPEAGKLTSDTLHTTGIRGQTFYDVQGFLIAKNANLEKTAVGEQGEKEKLKKRIAELEAENARLEAIITQSSSKKPVSQAVDLVKQKQIAETKQKDIDTALKELLVLQGMKGVLRYEWIPKGLIDYQKYAQAQDRSLKNIQKKIEKLHVKSVVKASTSPQTSSVSVDLTKRTPVSQAWETLKKPNGVDMHQAWMKPSPFAVKKWGTEVEITPENLDPVRLWNFITPVNRTLVNLGEKNPLHWAEIILKEVRIKGDSVWRVFLKQGNRTGYFTLKPGQKSRNYKLVSSESEMMQWAIRKVQKWRKA